MVSFHVILPALGLRRILPPVAKIWKVLGKTDESGKENVHVHITPIMKLSKSRKRVLRLFVTVTKPTSICHFTKKEGHSYPNKSPISDIK